MKKIFTYILTLFLFTSTITFVGTENTSALEEHNPIRIDSDTEFATMASNNNWAGSGNSSDPYIIEDYEIDGNGSEDCFYIGNTTVHFVFKNNYFHNSSEGLSLAGLFLNNVTHGIIENNTLAGNDRGIRLNNSDENVLRYNNITGNSVGLFLDESNNNTINDNNVYNNSFQGIWLHAENDFNEVIGNKLVGNSDGFVAGVWNEGGSEHNLIKNNKILNNSDEGIYMGFQSSNNEILLNYLYNNTIGLKQHKVNNHIHNNTIENNTDDGIQLRGSDHNLIEYNNIANNSRRGIWFWGSNDNKIRKNNLMNNSEGAYSSSDGGNLASNNSIIDNHISKNTEGVVFWDDSSDSIIRDNHIVNNSDYGIWMRDASINNTIENNEIIGGSTAIYLQESHDCQLIGNVLNGSTSRGIYLYRTNGTTIRDNEVFNIDDSIHDSGIYLRNLCTDNLILENFIHDNQYGIYLESQTTGTPQDNTIQANTIKRNVNGIRSYGTKLNTIKGNDFEYNNRSIYLCLTNQTQILDNYIYGLQDYSSHVYYGMYLLESHQNVGDGNKIYNNTRGIYIDQSTDNRIEGNELSNNKRGLYIYRDSEHNIVKKNYILNNTDYGLYISDSSNNSAYLNNFIRNNYNAMDVSGGNIYNDSSLGNYWDDYTGSDSDGDGIGDDPYDIPGGMCTDYYPLWDIYEDGIYWVEEGGTGEGKIEGSPAGNLSHVVDNYDLTNATVNVKAGEYNETVENYPLTVDEENVTFNALNGTDETFLVGAGSGLCYDVDASFVSINNFTITNFSTPIFIQNADNMVAKDNRLVENSANGIYAQNSQYNTMTGNHFSDNSGEDIYLSQIYDTQVKNNEFYHSGDESIYLRYSSYNMIKNNVVGDTNMGGIYLEHSSKNQIRDNTVSNSSMGIYLKDDSIKNYIGENSINNNGQASIWIDSTGNNTINNNIISESYAGIYIISGDNNTITMNSVENSSFQGIRIDGSDNNIVDNNVVRNSTNYNGIWVKSDKSVVSHNFVYNCNYGITLYSTTNSTAHNNTVESNQMKGIRLDKSDHNEVNDNTVTDNEDGIYLSDSQFNIIFGNTAEENVNHGIFLNGVSENEVSSNTVNSNQINGIYLDDADNNTLSTNTVNTNEENGIYIEESNNVTISYNNLDSNNYSAIVLEKCEENSLSNNVMTNNGIRIRGYQLLYWNTHSIISSNEVNGKPVEYIKDQDGGSVSNDAGQVILVNSSYIDVEGQDLSSASIGLQIAFSDNNTLSGSTLSDNSLYGVYLFESQDNLLSDNSMSSNDIGIYFHLSNDNIVRNGTISNSEDIGIDTINSNENNIYHNNFESNSRHVRDNYNNIYDDGYPSGGNYWDTYDGEDRYSGPDQDLPGRDGIGDSSYSIGTNADNYPLMESWPLDDTPPVISSVEVTDISTTSVTITWDTDEDSDSMVNFSINSDLSDYSSIYQYEFVTSHLIEIEGLESNTTYYSEVLSNDTVGNKVKADNDGSYYSFTTASIPLLEITDMTSGEPTTGDSFTLEMDVNEESRVSEVFFRWGFDGSISYNESVSSSTDTWSKTINVPSDAINLSYSFHVRYDSTKWTSTDVIEIDVIDNDAPVISMQVPNAVQVNNTADFSGSDSYDNIGIVNYTWEIEEIGEFLYGSTQSYIFNMTGNYTIKLTISDEAENEASSTRNIRVLSYTPSVVEGSVVDSESNPIEGATIYFDSGENITTESDGRFSTEVTSGNRTLTVVKTGYRNYTKEIFVENETTIDIGTIILNESVIVINYEPAGDEVPVESTIEIQYSDNIMSAEVKVSGLSGETEYSGTNVTFAPLNQMEYDTTYTVYVNATDMNGNKIDTFTWSFTTKSEDVFPSVIDYQPVGSEVPIDSIIEIQYSDDIMSVEIKVTDLSGEVKHSDANVTFTPLDPMEYDTTYTVYVNATDMDGNNLDMFTWSFTTEPQDQKEYGYVEGRITDADNNSLSGATVLFDSGEEFTTDQDGWFNGMVLAGSREITVTKDNYENFTDSFYIEKDQSKDFGNIVMQEIDSGEDEDEDSDSDLTGIGGSLKDNMLYMILALLIVIVLVIFILRKSSKPVKEEEELIEYKEEESTELEEIDEEEINIDPKEEGDMNSELQNEHSEDLDVEKDGDLLEKENQG